MHGRRVVEERRGDFPQPLDPVGPGEQGAFADERVVDQAFVGLELMRAGERIVVVERECRRRIIWRGL